MLISFEECQTKLLDRSVDCLRDREARLGKHCFKMWCHETLSPVPQDVTSALERFGRYHHIWKQDHEDTILKFSQGNPLLSEFESQILYYKGLEQEINSEREFITVGALALFTGIYNGVHRDLCSKTGKGAWEFNFNKKTLYCISDISQCYL